MGRGAGAKRATQAVGRRASDVTIWLLVDQDSAVVNC